jgi:cytochrome P450/NADPH-cytochrome P450 reductase
MYHLLKNPEKYHAAQAEVDRVLGDGALELKHLSELKYVEACIRETLRYQGPISQFVVSPKEDTVIANKYRVPKGFNFQCMLKGLHHDVKVWGDDVDVFRPERFLDGGYEELPPNAYKPFGNGRRACIGRAFAEQEMIMTTALILQRFQVEMADPSYHLGICTLLI